ncbi:MAG: carboxypeptidase regulatory-like domain-containing protein [Bryobacteraceae bacterium]
MSILLLAASRLGSQITGGSFTGIVTDPTGAVIADAKVEARNVATNTVTATTTTVQGLYEFPLLPAGRYVISVQQTGFRRATTAELQLNSGNRSKIDIALEVGEVTQSIEVVNAAPLVNATSQALGTVVDSQKVRDLPLNGRTFTQLLVLQPGVSLSGGNANRGGVELNGSSGLGNNWLMDGVDMSFGENNGVGIGGVGGSGTVINSISIEALEEFKVTTNAFSAEYGRATGGVINLTTKSGTNQYHGTLLYFMRNDKLDANNFFSNRANLGKPPLRHNQFGGNLGGPIIKDKLFFFYNFEGDTIRRGRTISGAVPTPLYLSLLKNPKMREHLSKMPTTFEPTSNPWIGQHFRNDRQKVNEQTHIARVDYVLGNHRLSGRVNHNTQDVFNPQLRQDVRQQFPLRQRNVMVSDFWVVSPRTSVDARFGFNRTSVIRGPDDGRQKPGPQAGYVSIGGLTGGSDLQDQLGTFTDVYSGIANITHVRGAHTFKAGTEIRSTDSFRDQFGNPRNYYNTLQDAIDDKPFQVEMYFGNPKGGYSFKGFAAYAQDDWRVNRRFQINLGLRYEYYQPFRGSIGLATRDPLGPRGNKGDPIWNSDRNNFGPRLGLVWDVFGSGKTIMRLGAGMTYIAPQPFFFYDAAWLAVKVPFAPLVSVIDIPSTLQPVTFPFPVSFIQSVRDNPTLVPAGLQPGLLAPDPAHRDEYALQGNYSIQQQVSSTFALQASYVLNRAAKLYSSRLINPINPATGRRDAGQDIGAAWLQDFGANMTYHAMQIAANKRLSKGLNFDFYYTLSKGIQYNNADNSFTRDSITQDFNWIAGSRGPKVSDVRHRATAVYSYEIPAGAFAKDGALKAMFGGWTLQGIMGYRAGFPLNVVTGRDNVGTGRPDGQRPDAVPGQNPYLSVADRLLLLNRAAFDFDTVRAQRRYGNLGYNTVRGPGAFTWDASVNKWFTIREGHRLNFRFEMFNWMNHTVLANPSTNGSDANFGRVTGVAVDPRNIQFGLKYSF